MMVNAKVTEDGSPFWRLQMEEGTDVGRGKNAEI